MEGRRGSGRPGGKVHVAEVGEVGYQGNSKLLLQPLPNDCFILLSLRFHPAPIMVTNTVDIRHISVQKPVF